MPVSRSVSRKNNSRRNNSRKNNSQQLTVSDLNKIRDLLIENAAPSFPDGCYGISTSPSVSGIGKRLKTRDKRYYLALGDITNNLFAFLRGNK